MKKGFVALLLALAVIVLVSPGIIGRLAERSVDESLNWAAEESSEVIVTTSGFERGWFASEGQHRVELLEGELHYFLLSAMNTDAGNTLPVLIIDTRLDHGLIPVTSMSRENGSLAPGLGSAVSTLSFELADGTLIDMPGRIFSSIGLGGSVESRYVLEAGGADVGGARVDWGDADIAVTTDAVSGDVVVFGSLGSLAIESLLDTTIIGKVNIDIDQERSGFGFMTGKANISLDSFAVVGAHETLSAGPIRIKSRSAIDDGRVRADLDLQIENTPFPNFGSSSMNLVARLENADAAMLAQLQRSMRALSAADDYAADTTRVENDALRLLAAGLELHFDQLDIDLPMGPIASRISARVSQSDDDDYSWTSAVLALDASANFSLPAGLVDMLTQASPEMHSAIAMGFLRKKGDAYIMDAAFKQGLLTVNGAPMPVPLPGMR